MFTALNIAILAGGLSHEREVSLKSGASVKKVLQALGHKVTVLDVDSDLLDSLRSLQPDVVWPLIHGGPGENGGLQNILISLGIPYVGTHSDGCQRATFKSTAKATVRAAGLLTPDSVTLPKDYFRQLGAKQVMDLVIEHLGLPVVVKPFQGGSGLGVSFASTPAELSSAIISCFAYDDNALIESYVEGIELAVSVTNTKQGLHALPPVEIVTEGNYDFDARYNPGRSEYFTPARLNPETIAQVQDVALTAHKTLGLGTISRTDMILDTEGKAWFIDVNVVPGMTDTSLFPIAAQATGDLSALYDEIVRAPLTQ